MYSSFNVSGLIRIYDSCATPGTFRPCNKLIWSVDIPLSANCDAWYFRSVWGLSLLYPPTFPNWK